MSYREIEMIEIKEILISAEQIFGHTFPFEKSCNIFQN
jgi:hypothetical protein